MTNLPDPSALWPLIHQRPLPRIHVLSDLHLDTGPYAMPPMDDVDIVVAAGDIGPIEIAVPWLAALNKPVVYVLGNHEYYNAEFTSVLAAARAAAKGTHVHVLERDTVVIDGVRFLGATLWASYGNWHPALVAEAMRRMTDYRAIKAGTWFNEPSHQKWFARRCRTLGIRHPEKGRDTVPLFHPAIAYLEHVRSVAWLNHQLERDTDLPTVVVTHHAPSFSCLRSAGVDEALFDRALWSRRYKDDNLVRVAAYASPLDDLLKRHRARIMLWAHGHLHHAEDSVVEGVRIVCNPRGSHEKPFDAESARAFALLGYPLSETAILRSQEAFAAYPYQGSGVGFDSRFIVNLEDGLSPALTRAVAPHREAMAELLAQAHQWLPYVAVDDSVPAQAVQQCLANTVNDFREVVVKVKKLALVLDRHLDAYGLRQLTDMPFSEPYPAHVSLFAEDEDVSLEGYAKSVSDLEAWHRWSDVMPHAAAHHLQHWASAACRVLRYLASQGITACVHAPPLAALRHVEHRDLLVALEVDAATRTRLEGELDALLNPRTPRRYFVQIRVPSDWGDLRAKSLTLAELEPWGNDTESLILPTDNSQRTGTPAPDSW